MMVTWFQLEQEMKNCFPTIKHLNFTIFKFSNRSINIT